MFCIECNKLLRWKWYQCIVCEQQVCDNCTEKHHKHHKYYAQIYTRRGN